MGPERIYLSAPHATEDDIAAVVQAMKSGWLAPEGPDLEAFESAVADYVGVQHAVALSSGTAALHLALKYVGVQPGDRVIIPTMTFAATAFAATYLGAEPVFVDIDESWNMDPELLDRAIREERKAGHRVSAAVPVDLYGTPANYDAIIEVLTEHEVPLVEDAAEGLGGNHGSRMLGSFGKAAALSFNGNKILTTSGGGMVLTDDPDVADRIRFWSTQSRELVPWYEHNEVGFNYRMSNLLAALGRSQLERLPAEVQRRRTLRETYRKELESIPGINIQRDPAWGASNSWLTVATVDLVLHPDAPARIRVALEAENIESRPVWKPMHQQPVFRATHHYLNEVSDQIYASSLCLPSGPKVTTEVTYRLTNVLKTSMSPT